MKIGITIWNDQVSPLLDAATQLLLAEVSDKRVESREMLQLPMALPWQRVSCIENTGIATLICGAISREYESLLQSSHIRVIPWTRGRIEEVLDAFIQGRLNGTAYCLPGRKRGRCRCRGGRGFRARSNNRSQSWNREEQ